MHILATSLLTCLAIVSAAHLDKRATCTVASHNNAADSDVPAISAALSSCGNGGTIVLSKGVTYALNEVLDLSACQGCTLEIEGTLKLSVDLDYWEGKTGAIYAKGMSNAIIKSVSGWGLIDGSGQKYWEVFSGNSSYKRPTIWYMNSVSGVSISNLKFINAPNVFHSVVNSQSVTYYNNTLTAVSTNSSVVAHNTDGWDIGSSSFVTVSHSNVVNDDDCVAFKAGATYGTIDTLSCTGSHGVSIGSLGGSKGKTDTVQNLYIQDITMINSAKALGIKLYQGGSSTGTAIVSNVTYDGVTVTNSDYAVQIQSCYGSSSASDCAANPSQASVTGFTVKNVSGTVSGSTIVSLDCPAAGTCDVYLQNFSVKPKSGTAAYLCSNVDNSDLCVTCTGAASG
ncbi:pectin lyase-like protein [Punctularia strigosozonata HHB-11173 SS5]|uniref:pectin lyase-like protein n=1 Tax=Punctularia strigosozonata (strain HHB-11173) TaxID=741275 RepID=UPI0004418184|nr:pectin lyase-like protein [Punctularia strigosozonata HHB-11173 SS5]EIN13701.1 pectin lyase-like protein [Punctularia strigosozonata HHB-11173 SS5]